MGILTEAVIQQTALKLGGYGAQGSGKSTTLLMLLIGMSLTHHGGAPIVMVDTENGSDFLIPIAQVEGVKLYVIKSRAFKDMRQALYEAEALKACGFLVDSYTHPWTELVDSFKARSNKKRLELHHMDELKRLWRQWTDQFLGSPLHIALSGRLGNVWDNELDTDGETKLVRLGSKMKGETDAGYEPHLLFEIESIDDPKLAGRDKRSKQRRSGKVHNITIAKDRWRDLNGKTFSLADINNYKKGDWKKVYDIFRPHVAHFNIGGEQRAVDGNRSSADMFAADDTGWKRKKEIALEEIRESIVAIYPGRTDAEKRLKQVLLETLFGTLSWAKVESLRLEELDPVVPVLQALRGIASTDGGREDVSTPDGLVVAVNRARAIVAEAAVAGIAAADDDDVPL